MKKNVFFLLGLMLFWATGISQTLTGTVVDASDGNAIPGATVLVVGTNIATITDLEGHFVLSLKENGKYQVKISFMGYQDEFKNVDVKGEDIDLGKIALQQNAIGIDEVKVMASYATDRKTPVAVSNIKPEMISEKLGNQEFPEILKTTPSVYATKQGGGYGDSRINIRGFDSQNVGVLINGVPVNDMENGKVYWSNWAGLSDVTRSIQVQRGLGASRLAISSVGGTINIITKTTDMKRGGSVYYSFGNNHYNKMAFTVSTGMTNNGWAVTVSGSHTKGDGYVEATQFEGWSYYFNVSKRFSERNQLSFNLFGAPQTHNQRSFTYPIETYREDPMGIRMNHNYGYRNGQIYNGDHAYNYYHKPVLSLNHFWKISSNLTLNTALYASFGRGGGRRIYGPNANWLKFNYPDGSPTSSTMLTPEGYLNYDTVIYLNSISLTGSKAIISNSVNSHDWYGILSTLRWTHGNITVTGGYDGRYYKGYHYQQIDDLLGGRYFLDSRDVNRDPGTPLHEGDLINYYTVGVVLWNGLFSQFEYSTDKFSAFVNATSSFTQYRRIDYFQYTPEEGQITNWKGFLTYSVKGGVNYNINEHFNVFANGGYFTRPPFMKYVFVGYTNEFNDSAKVERVMSTECGMGYRSKILKANVYLYYTKWMDKALTRQLGDILANITGLNAVHKGIEFTSTYKPNRRLDISAMMSVGDWRWQKDVIANLYDVNQQLVGVLTVYAAGLHVSDAAQTTAALSVDYNLMKDLKVGFDWTYYDRLYARFDVENRADKADRGVESWRMPAYELLDLSVKYKFDFGPYKATLFGKVNNVLNTEYFSDGLDGNNHDAASSYVYYGFGRTWTLALRLRF